MFMLLRETAFCWPFSRELISHVPLSCEKGPRSLAPQRGQTACGMETRGWRWARYDPNPSHGSCSTIFSIRGLRWAGCRPCSSVYALKTSRLIKRRGARRPVNSSNWANPCSGRMSRPSIVTQPRWASRWLWSKSGVCNVLYANSTTTPPVGLSSHCGGRVKSGAGVSPTPWPGMAETMIVGCRHVSGHGSSLDFSMWKRVSTSVSGLKRGKSSLASSLVKCSTSFSAFE